jgi:hypothetical protein
MFKKAIKSAAVACLFASSFSQASVIVDTALWTLAPSPAANLGPQGLTSAGGNQAVQNTNSFGTIVSNFSFTGDFNFNGTMTPTTFEFNDDDILGLVFGWQNQSNHYRLGWEQGGYNDSGSGASGLFLVRELAGVSTILFQQEIFWADNVSYNFLVGRSGNNISFNINGISRSFLDTTFMSGKVGFYTESQTARFGGLASAPQAPNAVTEPSTLAILGLGLLGLGLRRKSKAN